MSRGLLILVLQLLIIAAMACLGIWTLVRPKSFQGFLHENFGLLPPVRDGLRLTPILIRLASIFFSGTPISSLTRSIWKSSGSGNS